MWSNHVHGVEQFQGRSTAVKPMISIAGDFDRPPVISDTVVSASNNTLAVPQERKGGRPRKESISVEVSVPTSKYEYAPLEPPIIETPQLRDMGEATPPLEWIGLHRDRLPNLTHQVYTIVISS